jgi:arabinogalactan oligomer/maltooligosaccharide transport system permease protein
MAMVTGNVVNAMRDSNKKSKTGVGPYLYILPTLLLIIILGLFPVLFQLWMSFTDFTVANLRTDGFLNFVNPPKNIGLANYAGILTSDQAIVKLSDFSFFKHLGFNFFWAVTSVFTTLTAGILIAILLNAEGLWGKRFYRALFILPMTIPTLVVNAVWRNMFDPQNGAINLALMAVGSLFGIPRETFEINWLGSINHFLGLPITYFAMIISNFWRGWPWVTIIATGALQSISKDMYEAASIDGATAWDKLTNITLPLLRPAMVPAAVLSFGWTFNLTDIAYFLTGGGPFRETELLTSLAFRLTNEFRLYGVAAAFSVIIFFVAFAMFLVTNRVTRATESVDL